MPRRLSLLASSLAVALLLVGCGSDDDSSDDGDSTTTTEAESTTTEDTTESSEADEPEETTTSTEAEGTDETTTTAAEGGEGEGDATFCAAYAAFEESFDDLPDETLEDIQSGSEAIRDALAELDGIAPEELADHTARLVQAGDDLVAATAAATTLEEAEAAGGEVFLDEEFTAAAEAVDGYYTERCPEANDDQAAGSSAEG